MQISLSFAEVESTIVDMAGRIKANKLALSEMIGGTFTITNGGVYGSLHEATPDCELHLRVVFLVCIRFRNVLLLLMVQG